MLLCTTESTFCVWNHTIYRPHYVYLVDDEGDGEVSKFDDDKAMMKINIENFKIEKENGVLQQTFHIVCNSILR